SSTPSEPPMVEDEAPLSPRGPGRLPLPSMPATSSAPSIEPRIWSPNRGDTQSETRPSSRPDQIARFSPPPPPERSERKEPEAKESGLFDVMWPDVKPGAEPAKREVKLDGAKPDSARPDSKSDFKPDFKPDPPASRRDEPVAEKRPEVPPAPPAERQPAILKS